MCRFEARRTFQNIVQHLQKHLENHLYGASLYLVPGDIPAEGEGDHRDDVEDSTEAAESKKNIFIVKLRQGSGKDRQGMAHEAKGLKA